MIVSNTGAKIQQEEYENEDELQTLIFEHPELIDEDGSELVSVAREVNTAAGKIDILAVSANGTVTLIEVKLGRNGQSRREVLAQILDYISELTNYSYYRLNAATDNGLEKAVDGFENSTELPRMVEDNLRNGSVRLVIAVDESNEDLKRLVEFVARRTHLRVDLVEIKKYLNDGEYYYSSNIIVQSSLYTMPDRVAPNKEYPLLDKAVHLLEQLNTAGELGNSLTIQNDNGSFRQIKVKGWPAKVHYEFAILRNKPILHVRLDNELPSSDYRSQDISAAMGDFVGKEIDGYVIESKPYSPATGAGRVIYIMLAEEEIDMAGKIMAELIKKTRGAVTQAIGGSADKRLPM